MFKGADDHARRAHTRSCSLPDRRPDRHPVPQCAGRDLAGDDPAARPAAATGRGHRDHRGADGRLPSRSRVARCPERAAGRLLGGLVAGADGPVCSGRRGCRGRVQCRQRGDYRRADRVAMGPSDRGRHLADRRVGAHRGRGGRGRLSHLSRGHHRVLSREFGRDLFHRRRAVRGDALGRHGPYASARPGGPGHRAGHVDHHQRRSRRRVHRGFRARAAAVARAAEAGRLGPHRADGPGAGRRRRHRRTSCPVSFAATVWAAATARTRCPGPPRRRARRRCAGLRS